MVLRELVIDGIDCTVVMWATFYTELVSTPAMQRFDAALP